MNMTQQQIDVSELLEKVDILDYISQYAEFFEKGGEWWALSPLKKENTPSFSINVEKQCFYDFSSGRGGSVIEFVKCYNKVSFARAIEILCDYYKIDGSKFKSSVLEATGIAKKFAVAKTSEKETETNAVSFDYVDRFIYDEEKLHLWEQDGITLDTMKKYGVMYDPLTERIVVPIRDQNGEIVNVCGRTTDKDFKSKKIRKYTYLSKWANGSMETIYGLFENRDEINRSGEVILVEGIKSVLLLDQYGFHNGAAVLTSHISQPQADILIGMGVRVTFALDKEVDIREDKNALRLMRYLDTYIVRDTEGLLDEKMAPVDAGEETWKKLYERRKRAN